MNPFYKAEIVHNERQVTVDDIVRATGGPREEIEKAMARLEREMSASQVWKNDEYQVIVRSVPPREHGLGDGANLMHLSIRRLDREPIRDWRALQEIKNALGYSDCDAFELFPAEDRLVDTANQYHLWVLSNPRTRLPVGWWSRMVLSDSIEGKTVQRPRKKGGDE